MADDDEEEMRAMRKSSAYSHQSSIFGNIHSFAKKFSLLL